MLKLPPKSKKSLNKTKRTYVWCLEKPKCITSCFGKRLLHKRIQKKSEVVVKFPDKVRCPECGKQFKSKVMECQDANCWHLYIPKHKKWIKL